PWLEDGILTAYEIASLDLSNTELIVLSACDTGLGDVEGNDGVYGLQRALKIAGVKYILMSLWQVPDAATMELMTRFYKAWLKQNLPVRKALYQAQKEMRKEGYEPLDWAGFILIE
ncbi:MAG TPA: CHAT domain-containing protein, partial [Saprospiraceae bacterium]|nr:CHAT domain-containing protein [Saprospiraceae bacterium]